MKVALGRAKKAAYRPPGHAITDLLKAQPFYRSNRGPYFHRVRFAEAYWRDGQLSHIAITYWCGNRGFLGEKGRLYGKIPEGEVLCAICEGKAIGAGMVDGGRINGRPVKYSPRKRRGNDA